MATEPLILGGERTASADGATFDVIEPATGAPMAKAAVAGAEELFSLAARALQKAGHGDLVPGTREPVLFRFSEEILPRSLHEIFVRTVEEGEKVIALMAEHGLTMADLSSRGPTKKTGAGAKVAAKYRNQATGESWSGRGLQPRWLKAALASGRKLTDTRTMKPRVSAA